MKEKIKFKNTLNKKFSIKWILTILIWTFALSIIINSVSSGLMPSLNIAGAFVVLILLIFMGIIFDIIGIAVATATEIPFHSMSTKNVRGSKQSIMLIKHSEKVTSFCNDVVGDITGIISGSAAAIIISRITYNSVKSAVLSIALTAFVASLTVGGKALGKTLAMRRANAIVYKVGVLIYYIQKLFRKI